MVSVRQVRAAGMMHTCRPEGASGALDESRVGKWGHLSLSDNFLWWVPRYGLCEDFATAVPMDARPL